MKCLFGMHSWTTALYIEWRDDAMVEVEVIRCERCFALGSERVRHL